MEGHHVIVRLVTIGDEGREHLRILRKLARGPPSLMVENHIVPVWGEVQLEDITIIYYPYIGNDMEDCYGRWAKNSVGDIVDMILQALEVRHGEFR